MLWMSAFMVRSIIVSACRNCGQVTTTRGVRRPQLRLKAQSRPRQRNDIHPCHNSASSPEGGSRLVRSPPHIHVPAKPPSREEARPIFDRSRRFPLLSPPMGRRHYGPAVGPSLRGKEVPAADTTGESPLAPPPLRLLEEGVERFRQDVAGSERVRDDSPLLPLSSRPWSGRRSRRSLALVRRAPQRGGGGQWTRVRAHRKTQNALLSGTKHNS